MPMIRVDMFAGRTAEQKRELVKELTETYVRVMGGSPEAVSIILTDVEQSDWAKAGQLFSDRS